MDVKVDRRSCELVAQSDHQSCVARVQDDHYRTSVVHELDDHCLRDHRMNVLLVFQVCLSLYEVDEPARLRCALLT